MEMLTRELVSSRELLRMLNQFHWLSSRLERSRVTLEALAMERVLFCMRRASRDLREVSGAVSSR